MAGLAGTTLASDNVCCTWFELVHPVSVVAD